MSVRIHRRHITLEQDSSFAYSLGETTGELSAVLATVNLDMTPVYRPYYALQQSYPLCNRETVQGFCLHPPEPLKDLHEELRLIGKLMKRLQIRFMHWKSCRISLYMET